MSLPRRDIVPVDPARNVADEDPPSRPGAQHQPPQVSMDGSQFVQWLSVQAGNVAGDLQHNVRALMVRASSCLSRTDVKKYPAFESSWTISNTLTRNYRLCYGTRLWRLRHSRVSGRWQVKSHMTLEPELFTVRGLCTRRANRSAAL